MLPKERGNINWDSTNILELDNQIKEARTQRARENNSAAPSFLVKKSKTDILLGFTFCICKYKPLKQNK